MRTSMMAAGLVALALAGGCAKAHSDSAGGPQKLTLAQFQQRRVEQMMKADTNGDGKISKDEFTAYMKQRFAARGEDVDDPDLNARIDSMFARQDRNGDGFITKDEIEQGAADMFARLDTAHKGYITPDQFRRGRPGGGQGGWGGGQGGGPGGGQGGGGQGG